MNEIIYLENDEEITSVIDRLRKSKENSLVLVIPRGGSLAQSIVNLKLLKKSAGEMGKQISLVSNDKISRNLASQIGLAVFSKASEAEKAKPVMKNISSDSFEDGDFKVNSYYGKDEGEELPADDEEIKSDSGEAQEDIEDNQKRIADVTDEQIADEEEPKKFERREIEKSYKEPEIAKSEKLKAEGKQEHSKFERPKHEEPKERKPLSRSKKIAIGIISGAVAVLLAVSYLFLPYAKATVMVKTEDLDVSQSVIINLQASAIDRNNLIIPATTVSEEKEISKTYSSTGKKDQGVKATGKITIYNEWDDKTKTFAAGTRFSADDGKVFVSTAEATVPGATILFAPIRTTAGTVDVNVSAENTGESYNIGPTHFNISGVTAAQQSKIYGRNASAMTGGTTKTVSIVSDADYKTAEADLTKSILDLGKEELSGKAKEENMEIIESKVTSSLVSKEASKNVNDEAANFDYRLRMKLSVISYSTDDLKKVLIASTEKNIGDKMLVGQDKYEASATFIGDIKPVDGATNSGEVEIKGAMKAKTGQKISDKDIKNRIKGKKYAEAKRIIENYDKVESVNLNIWPTSITRVPLMTSRIKVIFDYAQ